MITNIIINIIISGVISFIIGYIIGRVTYKPTRTFISIDEANQRIGKYGTLFDNQKKRIEAKDSPFSPETTQSIENTRKMGEKLINRLNRDQEPKLEIIDVRDIGKEEADNIIKRLNNHE
ncbi:MAG: hypothetical protein CVT92_02285 [Bacteroidetes bacterium HGW-Bacteroidetes-1]|jgi:hypothetical protein|nr:MAG: hypothetical protein CVT92_02285 [Bacteroidetes bacterium HGW-Bacteroidetes-1]